MVCTQNKARYRIAGSVFIIREKLMV